MAGTQIKGKQIKDDTITGADTIRSSDFCCWPIQHSVVAVAVKNVSCDVLGEAGVGMFSLELTDGGDRTSGAVANFHNQAMARNR